MKKVLSSLILILSFFLCGCFETGGGQAIVDREAMRPRLIESTNYSSTTDIVKSVSPAVVGIYSETYSSGSIGTGVAISEGGYVLTNSHVVTSNNVILYLASGDTAKASLVYRDSGLDLAILKSSTDLPYLEVATNGSYFVGEDVLAIGTPLALQFKHTVTKGIISATNRTIKVDGSGGATLNNLIQHDASINPGNSGGPLINLKGQVIGINTVKVEDAEGLGFAIPTETITPIFKKLSANGEYKPAFLGLSGYDASVYSGNQFDKGVYVFDVKKGSALDKLGIKKGDIIVAINDTQIDNMLSLRKKVYSLDQGEEISVTFIKDNFENVGKIVL